MDGLTWGSNKAAYEKLKLTSTLSAQHVGCAYELDIQSSISLFWKQPSKTFFNGFSVSGHNSFHVPPIFRRHVELNNLFSVPLFHHEREKKWGLVWRMLDFRLSLMTGLRSSPIE